jgi:diguanylate cyclase (GGDEF)-like protein/PAS domain S-box-containing protein
MKKKHRTGDSELEIGFYVTLLISFWTLMVIFSIIWRINQESYARLHQAKEIARSHLEKDLLIRDWNINHGFVYAPVTAEHQPNPILKIPEREIVTSSGKTLTAINSSSMIRQIYEMSGNKLAYRGHLTSLKPLRPENAPDPWEEQALKKLGSGTQEVNDVVNQNNELFFRLMQPLTATERCLPCHSRDDYTPGKVVGGISMALPMASVVDAWQKTRLSVILAHGFLWLIGLLGLIFGAGQLQKKIKAKHEMEKALRQSEANFRILVKTIPALVYKGYADGRVDFVDDKVEQLTGYSMEEFSTGQIKWPDIIVPEDLEGSKKIFLQALKDDGAYRREYRIKRQDGENIWVAERSQIICDTQGQIEFISGVILDISLQKGMEQSLKESERFWKTLLESVGVGLIVINRINGRITEVNPEATTMLGYKREQIIGQNHQKFFIGPLKQQLSSLTLLEREERSEGKMVKADGTIMPVWLTAALIKIEKTDFILASFVDLTEQRQAEIALTQANEDLQAAMAEVGQTNKEMGLLGKMVELLQICQAPDEAYPIIGQFTHELFPEISGALYSLNSSKNLLTAVNQWGSGHIGTILGPLECWALRQGRSYRCGQTSNASFHPRCHHIPAGIIGSHLCLPLTAQGETLGLLYLEKISEGTNGAESENDFSKSQLKLAKTLAEHISLSLANLKLRETLRYQAIRDTLTGLFNRRYLQETLAREIHRAQRQETTLGVVMLDVDNFKIFNDTYGHEAGDKLLAVLGRYLRGCIRAEDIACRYGGEEFTLILPDVPPEILKERAETIRIGVTNLEVLHQGKILEGITVSLGLSYFPQYGTVPETLLQAADAALYQAKKNGRNKVVMCGPQPEKCQGVRAA